MNDYLDFCKVIANNWYLGIYNSKSNKNKNVSEYLKQYCFQNVSFYYFVLIIQSNCCVFLLFNDEPHIIKCIC